MVKPCIIILLLVVMISCNKHFTKPYFYKYEGVYKTSLYLDSNFEPIKEIRKYSISDFLDWYRGDKAIQINIETKFESSSSDTIVTCHFDTTGYLFTNVKTKECYLYKKFCKDSLPYYQYKYEDKFGKNLGYKFYEEPKKKVDSSFMYKLSDTTINKINYKRVLHNGKSKNDSIVSTLYLRKIKEKFPWKVWLGYNIYIPEYENYAVEILEEYYVRSNKKIYHIYKILRNRLTIQENEVFLMPGKNMLRNILS